MYQSGPLSADFPTLGAAYRTALERSIADHLARTGGGIDSVSSMTLRDIRGELRTAELISRRSALGLSLCPNSRLFVDAEGNAIPTEQFPSTPRRSATVCSATQSPNTTSKGSN